MCGGTSRTHKKLANASAPTMTNESANDRRWASGCVLGRDELDGARGDDVMNELLNDTTRRTRQGVSRY
jgi:hypothetical protein